MSDLMPRGVFEQRLADLLHEYDVGDEHEEFTACTGAGMFHVRMAQKVSADLHDNGRWSSYDRCISTPEES